MLSSHELKPGKRRKFNELLSSLTIKLIKPNEQKDLLKAINKVTLRSIKHFHLLNSAQRSHLSVINKDIIFLYANTISAISQSRFACIDLEDIHDWPQANSFISITDLWNILSHFVVNDILSTATKNRELLYAKINRWINVAWQLYRKNDFFSAHVVYSAISHWAIERLFQKADQVVGLAFLTQTYLTKLQRCFNRGPVEIARDTVAPCEKPKLFNINSYIDTAFARWEELPDAEKQNQIKKLKEDIRMLFTNYSEQIDSQKISGELVLAILSHDNKQLARDISDRKTLSTRCCKLETIKNLSKEKGDNYLDERIRICKFAIKLIQEKINSTEKIYDKTFKFRPRVAELKPCREAENIGQLIERIHTLSSVQVTFHSPIVENASAPAGEAPKDSPLIARKRSASFG